MHFPIYLDYMATTPVAPEVAQKMREYMTIDGVFGNPASQHSYGIAAKEAVEKARQQVALLINADAGEIVWTSGATEADNLAIKGAVQFYKRKGKHIITSKIEHKAVLDTCKYLETEGFEVTYLNPEPNGLLDLDKLISAMRKDTILVSLMHVNNEIGVINDIAAIGEITRPRGILFHVDAAQGVGKIPLDVKKIKVDLLSLASHKIYGPKGIGSLYVRNKPRLHLEPQMHGGDQEFGLRSGTLPTHQIVGMGEAFALADKVMEEDQARILKLRNMLWDGIQNLNDVYLNGDFEKRVAGNLNVGFAGIEGEVLLAALKDIAVSTGAACFTTSIEPSYVLRALGVKIDLAYSSIRFSLGRYTTKEEINYTIRHICDVVRKLRVM